MDEVENALEALAADPHFGAYPREQLLDTGTFIAAVRSAPHGSVVAHQEALDAIAFATADYGEASGVVIQVAAFGGGLTNVASTDEVPVTDVDAFAQWVVDRDPDDREDAADQARDSLIRALVASSDAPEAQLRHRTCLAFVHYGLDDAEDIAPPVRDENHDGDFPVGALLHRRLWEAFEQRPEGERAALIEGWWGPDAPEPHDLAIALAWQSAGHIAIAKTPGYFDAVAELLLWWCEPDADAGRASQAATVLGAHPGLAADLVAALGDHNSRRWLVGPDPAVRAAYLGSLVADGLVDRAPVLAALNAGAQADSDPQYREQFAHLRSLV